MNCRTSAATIKESFEVHWKIEATTTFIAEKF